MGVSRHGNQVECNEFEVLVHCDSNFGFICRNGRNKNRVQAKLLLQRDPKVQWIEYDQNLFLSSSSHTWSILTPPLKLPTLNYFEENSRRYIIFKFY